jgi:hypothetical protein
LLLLCLAVAKASRFERKAALLALGAVVLVDALQAAGDNKVAACDQRQVQLSACITLLLIYASWPTWALFVLRVARSLKLTSRAAVRLARAALMRPATSVMSRPR